MQLHLIELPKADRLRTLAPHLADWVTYFKHWKDEATMSSIANTHVKQAMQTLHHLSADEKTRQWADVREKALRDEASELKAAEMRGEARGEVKGRVEGKAEGKAEGELEGSANTLKRLLTRRFGALPSGVQARIAQADLAQLERWEDRLLDAASLEEVFR